MAVLVYLGVGISSFPTRLPDALSDYIGETHEGRLRVRVDQLLGEADLDAAEWGTMNLSDATRRVEDNLRVAHPELSEDAVRALAWNYSYTNR